MTTIEFMLISALALYNTPYPTQARVPTLIPSLKIEYHPFEAKGWSGIYFSDISSARCQPIATTLWNPITALWRAEAGYRVIGKHSETVLGIGHQSEHGVDKIMPSTESMHYAVLKYTLILK